MRNILFALRFKLIMGCMLMLMMCTPLFASAQVAGLSIIPKGWESGDCNITNGKMIAACIPWLIGYIIGFIFNLISAFFILNVIYAGYQMALGSWTGEKSEGKDRLTWSIIGLVISVCAYLILDLVVSIITT